IIVRNSVIVGAVLLLLAFVFGSILAPLLESLNVDEEFTTLLGDVLIVLLPVVLYVTIGISARAFRDPRSNSAPLLMLAGVTLAWLVVSGVQTLNTDGSAATVPSLQFTLAQTDDGVRVEALEPGGTAETAGVQVGDVITAIRRDPVDLAALEAGIAQSEDDTPLRLRIQRDGEELQLTVRTVMVAAPDQGIDVLGIVSAWLGVALLGALGLYVPGGWIPYMALSLGLLPLLLGYAWLLIATFSYRTEGLLPLGPDGSFGGLTLDNWSFLTDQMVVGGQTLTIWSITLNSFFIAVSMTLVSLVLCSMGAYALSRMEFRGRRMFLAMTLILHGFPAVTLLIPIYLVLIGLGALPLIGQYIGFNSLGGIALVMVAFELPFGIWLMKGFFDNISWDIERSALIDGATRWRTFWEIILPQIRPGLLALGIFAFIGGWNAYLIPATYTIGPSMANLPVYIRQLTGEVNPAGWNLVAAVGLFQMVPILVFFIFGQEYLLNIYAGGTKGNS
ncbi:MAG: ABC transporter permease subunit, partial [Chloroflexi bacterium]|nr:ABC transporter permease subunit [Chloroflexota bacterium]